jgi:hypothetical protein
MFEETGERIVATKVLRRRGDQVLLSTVWVGIDRSFSANPHAKPLIFETVVYGGPLDGEVVYYSSEDEARAGHEAMIAAHRKMRIGWLLKCWMFFTHSLPTLRESMIHPRSAALARTALILWTMIAVFGVANFFQSLLVGRNYSWAPANFIVTVCLLIMCGWALKGHRWVQAQTKARAALAAEAAAFDQMMNPD